MPPPSIYGNPAPTAAYAASLGGNSKTSQTATVATAAMTLFVASAAAGGKGPPGSVPDGSKIIRETDRRCESAFYRDATYTRSTTNKSAQPPFVLQEVPLTSFDGDIREYRRFRDRFLDLMEAQPDLEPRHKLVHLLQYLRGEPHRMADRLHLTDENYFVVVDRLERRYGDEVALHNLLIRDLARLPTLTSTRLSDVTRFYDDAFQLITDLRPFLDLADPSNTMRLYLLEESSYAAEQTADSLLNALDNLIWRGRQILNGMDLSDEPTTDVELISQPIWGVNDEESEHTREDEQEESLQGFDQDSPKPADHQKAVAMDASAEPRLKERRTCPLCGLLHTAFRCAVFRTINGRLRRIQKLKLCLLCLREGHQAATCPRKTTDSCKICNKGPHHRAVCMTANDRTRASSRRRSPVSKTGSSDDPQHPDQHQRVKKKSVNWTNTKSVSTATNLRQSEAQSSSKSTPKTSRKKRSKKRGAAAFQTKWHVSSTDQFNR